MQTLGSFYEIVKATRTSEKPRHKKKILLFFVKFSDFSFKFKLKFQFILYLAQKRKNIYKTRFKRCYTSLQFLVHIVETKNKVNSSINTVITSFWIIAQDKYF